MSGKRISDVGCQISGVSGADVAGAPEERMSEFE